MAQSSRDFGAALVNESKYMALSFPFGLNQDEISNHQANKRPTRAYKLGEAVAAGTLITAYAVLIIGGARAFS